jgi:peroxiredoxin
MKKAFLLVGVFVLGVIAGVASFSMLVGKDSAAVEKAPAIMDAHGNALTMEELLEWTPTMEDLKRGSAMVHASSLEAQADWAIKIRMGEYERFLSDFELNAPSSVKTVLMSGDYDFVHSALRKVKGYYEVSGKPIPKSIAAELENVTAGGTAAGNLQVSKSTRLKVGDPSPLLSLNSIDGRTHDLSQKVVVLNIFATWCSPCKKEMPRLQKDIWEPYRAKGLEVIGIGLGHSIPELKRFQKENIFSYPIVADSTKEISKMFASGTIPRCVLIGKNGKIKAQTVGFNLVEHSRFLNAVKKEISL